MIAPLQEALSARGPGARIDVRTVETGPPTLIPISIRVQGEDAAVLRAQAEKLQAILKSSPLAINIRDDWGNDALRTHLNVDQDRASLAGLSSQDIAISSYSAVSGIPVGVMREGRKNIPIVQLMNYGQRDTATALNQLYVYSGQTPQNITLVRSQSWPIRPSRSKSIESISTGPSPCQPCQNRAMSLRKSRTL